MTKTIIPKQYSPTREEILNALGAVSETEYNKMWRSLDEKTKEINELVQKMHILEKELNLYKRAIERTDRIEKCLNQEGQIIILQEQLRIATKALEEYANCKSTEWMSCVIADKALKEIKETINKL